MAVANNTQDGFVVIGVKPPASASHEPIFGELVNVSWEETNMTSHGGRSSNDFPRQNAGRHLG